MDSTGDLLGTHDPGSDQWDQVESVGESRARARRETRKRALSGKMPPSSGKFDLLGLSG